MKRLYKDKSNAKIDGVCAGLAEYLDIDVTIIRIIWAACFAAYGSGLMLYLICCFVLPDKKDIELY